MESRSFQAGWTSATSGSDSLRRFVNRLLHARSPSSAFLLSDIRIALVIVFVYLTSLYALGRRVLPPHKASLLQKVAILHNVILSIASLIMNLHVTRALFSVMRTQHWHASFCTPYKIPLPKPLLSSIYFFYLSKFHELLDTFILLLRNKPLTLLHVWHHSSVIFSVWGWLEYGVTIGGYGVWFNTFVHIFMYAYFALRLARIRLPFKRIITLTQIVQFMTGFATLIPFTWLYITKGACNGVPGLIFTAFINGSYLILFIRFYSRSYKSSSSPQQQKKQS